MSRYFSSRFDALVAYVPGEQPKENILIKLNTNESPFPPSPAVREAAALEAGRLELYSDPECRDLVRKASEYYGVSPDELLMTNGSDEILNFAFTAFGDESHPFAFADITYGFYPVFAALLRIPTKIIPLRDGFRLDPDDYKALGANIVIANPNAPTGLYLKPDEIEYIVKSNPDNVVVIDEAYIDFGGESCLPLVHKYGNLLVTRTFSKSFSMAGARLGFGIGSRALIADMNTIKYSTNPYNVNRMTMAAGKAALEDADYYMANCQKIIATREATKTALRDMGFTVTDSGTNFLFAAHPAIGGKEYALALRKQGILVRHFDIPRIADYNRITVGTDAQMARFIKATESILKGTEA